jgi:hypothetical protein
VTATRPDVDTARARDLDEAHVAWCMHRMDRASFGKYAIDYLGKRGLVIAERPAEVADRPERLTVDGVDLADFAQSTLRPLTNYVTLGPLADGEELAAALGLRDGPHATQAAAMQVEEVADLLAALAERDLRWVIDEADGCGTLIEGDPEPPDLHVVFDAYRSAWQRDDDRARDDDPGDWGDQPRWFGPNGSRRTWTELQRTNVRVTPDGGIAPTTPRDES